MDVIDLPPGYTYEKVGVRRDGESCMGEPYVDFMTVVKPPTPLGTTGACRVVILGTGATPTDSIQAAASSAWEHHRVTNLTPDKRVEEILGGGYARGRLYDREVVEALSIIWKKLKEGK